MVTMVLLLRQSVMPSGQWALLCRSDGEYGGSKEQTYLLLIITFRLVI